LPIPAAGFSNPRDIPSFVMPGLVPGIHAFLLQSKTWMAGTSPAMTFQLSAQYEA
jgi:hypothetical protein